MAEKGFLDLLFPFYELTCEMIWQSVNGGFSDWR